MRFDSALSRRDFVRTAGVVAAGALVGGYEASAGAADNLRPAQILIDMVHNNPGEAPFVTHYNDPALLKSLGYSGKVYELFQAAQFGIDWSTVDPDIFPVGSVERTWVDKKAADLDKYYTATKVLGLDVYCHTDMIIFPKRLVEKYKLKDVFGDVSNPDTQKFLRAAIAQMFQRFPQLDGLVVRIGETYLQGAPYHQGHIAHKTDPQLTIVPLLKLLREEICEKLPGKKVLFRSWDSFDTSIPAYMAVSDGVEPHPNLMIGVKHCEDDFHRGDRFSRVLGIGRHKQVVEVQCQREYEGKGAYPNYVAHGVIEGFEETPDQSIRKTWANPLTVGMFTWSRGGGWSGPYITNELWCDLNVYVLSKWAQSPNRSEESIFEDYSRKVLRLSAADAAKFRRLALLSADAVYRGIRSTHNDIGPMWTRDHEIGIPPLPKEGPARERVLAEKEEAVKMWGEIVALAQSIRFLDAAVGEYAVTSSLYGLYVYTIYRDGFRLVEQGPTGDPAAIKKWIADYDATWVAYRKLKQEHPSCATLYDDVPPMGKRGIGALVEEMRKAIG